MRGVERAKERGGNNETRDEGRLIEHDGGRRICLKGETKAKDKVLG